MRDKVSKDLDVLIYEAYLCSQRKYSNVVISQIVNALREYLNYISLSHEAAMVSWYLQKCIYQG